MQAVNLKLPAITGNLWALLTIFGKSPVGLVVFYEWTKAFPFKKSMALAICGHWCGLLAWVLIAEIIHDCLNYSNHS